MTDTDDLQSWFEYRPESGEFYRKKIMGKAKRGAITGTVAKNGYRYLGMRGKQYLAHRVAWLFMTGEWPIKDVDHIDRDRTNNAWANLREATRSQNLANSEKRSRNTSGFKGVSFFKPKGKWRARITFNYKEIAIGYFDCAEAANDAYGAKAKQLFGNFAVSK